MAAINFPDAPTNGQIFESGGMSWTYVAGIGWTLNSAIVEAGSGFTFIADTMPLPVNVGDTWFDSSTGASGGTSWVAVEEGPAGVSEKVWVQFAPGIGASPAPGQRLSVSSALFEEMVGVVTIWDRNHNDTTVYPFPTIAMIDISGIYLTGNAGTYGAYIYTNSYGWPGSSTGRVYTFAKDSTVATTNTWNGIGNMRAAAPIPAGASGIVWSPRFVGPGGSAGHSYLATMERIRA